MPPDSPPLISAIIPAYNAARFLPDAVDSIRRQNYAPLEILIVDDGSTDGTADLVRQWPDVLYLHQPNQGPAAARNVGIRAAQGDLLAFLDADDLWTADHLALLVPPLLADPRLRYAWGSTQWVRFVDEGGAFREQEVQFANHPLCLMPAGVFRRAAFDEAGLFDESLRLAEDGDWIAAARFKKLPFLQIPQNVLIYRRHAGSLTAGKGVQELLVLNMLQRSIQRHRGERPPTPATAADRPAA